MFQTNLLKIGWEDVVRLYKGSYITFDSYRRYVQDVSDKHYMYLCDGFEIETSKCKKVVKSYTVH